MLQALRLRLWLYDYFLIIKHILIATIPPPQQITRRKARPLGLSPAILCNKVTIKGNIIVKTKNTTSSSKLHHRILSVTRAHFYLLLAYAVAVVVFDSWNLYTHEIIAKRWTYGAVFAIICCLLWFAQKRSVKSTQATTAIAYMLIVSGVTFAALNVYIDRGMASKAVILFMLPLLVAAQLRSRASLLATAGISAAAYSIAAVRYFHVFYGEGLRIQLYGEVFFYSVVLSICALMLLPLIKSTD